MGVNLAVCQVHVNSYYYSQAKCHTLTHQRSPNWVLEANSVVLPATSPPSCSVALGSACDLGRRCAAAYLCLLLGAQWLNKGCLSQVVFRGNGQQCLIRERLRKEHHSSRVPCEID